MHFRGKGAAVASAIGAKGARCAPCPVYLFGMNEQWAEISADRAREGAARAPKSQRAAEAWEAREVREVWEAREANNRTRTASRGARPPTQTVSG
ncbi:hypothetical protein UA18_03914 [Burkholderia multivorans]|uniref:Uncharacterized protein n=1 Tax=Burkholderia multivorans TaxID=87883 RepID=A0ABD7L7S7_9BURK|nr:hypothetical protein UA17_03561 [Burkholderia multivorans]SAJ98549.1 hypothetical protein UA18_03914 [Burkholderia multivorans]